MYFKFPKHRTSYCRLSLPRNHNLRYISYSYNYKHQRASTLDGSIHPPTHHSIEDSIEETYARRQRRQPVNRPDSTRLISMGRSWPQIDRSPYLPAPLLPILLPIETRKSANHPRGEACHQGVRIARDVSPRSGRLIKRARVHASHNHHRLPPPPSAPAWGGKKINKIPSLRATAFIGHPISTTYFATSTFPPPPPLGHPPRPPHVLVPPPPTRPSRGGGQRLRTRERVCRSAARWRWSARKGD